jgi:hypothetical protein
MVWAVNVWLLWTKHTILHCSLFTLLGAGNEQQTTLDDVWIGSNHILHGPFLWLQVQKALSVVGLHQYQESFAREAVDGDMFMLLDDEILINELGVSSRLHRVRLLRMKET